MIQMLDKIEKSRANFGVWQCGFEIPVCWSNWDVFEGEQSGIVEICFSESEEKYDG